MEEIKTDMLWNMLSNSDEVRQAASVLLTSIHCILLPCSDHNGAVLEDRTLSALGRTRATFSSNTQDDPHGLGLASKCLTSLPYR